MIKKIKMICPLCHKIMQVCGSLDEYDNREWCKDCYLCYYHENYICWFLNIYVDNIRIRVDSYSDKMFKRLVKLKAFW
jgi:hypothetical protein